MTQAPAMQIDDKMIEAVKFEIAQLRHAYTHLLSHDMKGIANGLISPAIGTLERLTAALAEREPQPANPAQGVTDAMVEAFIEASSIAGGGTPEYVRAGLTAAIGAGEPVPITLKPLIQWIARTSIWQDTYPDGPDIMDGGYSVTPDDVRACRSALVATPPAEPVVEALPEGTLSLCGNDVMIQYAFHEQAQRAFDILEAAIAATEGRP